LIIHVCSEADFRKNNFSANFLSVSVFQCEASDGLLLRPHECGSNGQTVR